MHLVRTFPLTCVAAVVVCACAGGGGGSLAVSEEDPTNNLPNSLALSLGAIVTIMGCVFRDGAAAAGGAVLLGTLTRLDLETVEVARCRATQGGAVAVIQSPRRLLFVQRTIRLYDFQFHDNSADSVGGAIVLRSVIAAVDIGTSMIWNTQAQFGGAIFVHGGQINTIQYVSFENTVATVEGGQIHAQCALVGREWTKCAPFVCSLHRVDCFILRCCVRSFYSECCVRGLQLHRRDSNHPRWGHRLKILKFGL